MAFAQWSFPCKKNKFFKKVWTASFQVIIWSLWKERSGRVFNQNSSSSPEVQNLAILQFCWWIKGWKESFPYSPKEVMRNPSCLLWSHVSPAHLTQKPSQSILPALSCLKWVVEASFIFSRNRFVVGGALHNEKGELLCFFS